MAENPDKTKAGGFWKNARALWRLMRGGRALYCAAIFALAVATLLGFLVPTVMREAIDSVAGGTTMPAPERALALSRWLGGPSRLAQNLWIASTIVVGLTLLAGVCQHLKGRWTALASEGIVRRLRNRLFDHLQRLPCAYHAKQDTGDLVQRCTSDVETVKLFLSFQIVETGHALLMLVIAAPLMAAMDLRMALAALTMAPALVFFSVYFLGRVREVFKAADEAEAEMTTVIQENLTGIRVVRAFARQNFERGKFGEKNAKYRDRAFRLVQVMSWYWTAGDLLSVAQSGIVLVYGGWRLLQGSISVGTLYAFMAYVGMFLWPVRQMARILTDMGKATVSLGRIREILDEAEEEENAERGTQNAEQVEAEGIALRGEIEFRDVQFAYDGGSEALRGASFRIEAGETAAILGPTGSGKSTAIRLLLRLWEHQSGTILLDGRDVKTIERRLLRGQIAAASQEPFLFSRTAAENIGMGSPAANQEEMKRAAEAACIHESIQQFEQGYQTPIGERGVTLSGGQRQRMSLARAMLRNAPILVLDDTLSAVDSRTEETILDALRRRQGAKTTLLIAHRLSTLSMADKVIVMEGGRVTQVGTHEELQEAEGLYRRLWLIQNEGN